MNNASGDDHTAALLEKRAAASVPSLTDSAVLEWVLDAAEITLTNPNNIYAMVARNPNVNIGSACKLMLSESVNIRAALAANQGIPAAILFVLSLDASAEVRAYAVANPSFLRSKMVHVTAGLRTRYSKCFEPSEDSNSSFLACGVTTETSELPNIQRITLLGIALRSNEMWQAFESETGYTQKSLREMLYALVEDLASSRR